MISTKKLVKMAKKWQKFAVTQRKRILFPINVENVNEDRFSSSAPTTSSTKADNGCFVVYSADQQRFIFPLHYLSNEIFKELLKMSEEEFGLPCEGPIILPVDGKLLGYISAMIQRDLAGDIQKALLMSIATTRCSLPSMVLLPLVSLPTVLSVMLLMNFLLVGSAIHMELLQSTPIKDEPSSN